MSSRLSSSKCTIGSAYRWSKGQSSSLKSLARKVCSVFPYLFLGEMLEKEVGKVLGLTFGDKAKGTVKPL
jgi:hypothetical protein